MDSSDQLPLGFSPSLRVYKDGSFERVLEADVFVPPSVDPITGVSSKDVDIVPDLGVSARLYLPKLTESGGKLPIVVYYHGGGFCIQTPFSPVYHPHLNSLVAQAKIVAVSVHYRRAPEHSLPTAYDDAWAALQWTASHANGGSESWLIDHGDFTRLFVAGDSAGGNIVHNVALQAGNEELVHGVKIHGAILIQPYFWSTDASNKLEDPSGKAQMEEMWTLSCLCTTGLDDPRINPMATGAPSLRGLACKRVLVCAAEKDFVKELCWAYYHTLVSTAGWEGTAEMFETEDEDHCFHLIDPGCQKAAVMIQRFVDFINH